MAAVTSVVAIAGLALAAGGMAMSYSAQRRAKSQQEKAAREAEAAQREQSAQRASERAAEQRQQYRQERIRRGQILQAAENTGTAESSGEMGALSSLATQLADNTGQNTAAYQRGQRISVFSQNAANYQGQAQASMGRARMFDQLSSIGQSIYGAGGGMKSIMGTTGNGTVQTPNAGFNVSSNYQSGSMWKMM